MHEVAVAQQMLEVIRRTLEGRPPARVRVARLVLGRLTCVDPETLSFAFEVACRGTPAEGCRLDVERVPLRVRCAACGTEEERTDLLDPCGRCGNRRGEVIAGRELRLTTLDVEEDGP
ncbi:hydrogenase maturation nickel metallochaperone HypA [Myxococcota bacterium]|jgi:hydrogenase nickel incorporation protein HypA/HybF|nr:hydrogenase maturation nickel metallochaperone HypA [Myxococcota bacterium]